ncbi:MAG TPA: hypothetical protein VFT79_02745 [Solirubrobacterales bacterium]|nr:hypothetical protein [Solirubrobacterales bacterium]
MILAILGSLLPVFAATASAAPRDPIAGGTTDLHMKKGMLRKLGNLGVTVQAIGTGATSGGSKIGLAVRGGMLDPTNVEGFLENRGGFKFQLGNRGVPVTQLTVNTVKGTVFAKIAKARMQLGTFAPPTFEREGFGSNFKAVKLSLTEKATRRISNRLGLKGSKRLNPGRVLSNLYSTAQPETVTVLPQGSASLTGNATTLGKFAAKGVKVPEGFTPIAPASQPNPTSFALPIAGGALAPDAGKGLVEIAGGVQILKDTDSLDPTMRLTNVQVDFAAKTATVQLEILPSPPFPGAAGRTALVDVVLPPNSVVANPLARTISIQGAEARLQATAASTLNDVFNQPAPAPPPSSNFVVGDPLGTFSMEVQAR